jgi:hypothetical protein
LDKGEGLVDGLRSFVDSYFLAVGGGFDVRAGYVFEKLEDEKVEKLVVASDWFVAEPVDKLVANCEVSFVQTDVDEERILRKYFKNQ